MIWLANYKSSIVGKYDRYACIPLPQHSMCTVSYAIKPFVELAFVYNRKRPAVYAVNFCFLNFRCVNFLPIASFSVTFFIRFWKQMRDTSHSVRLRRIIQIEIKSNNSVMPLLCALSYQNAIKNPRANRPGSKERKFYCIRTLSESIEIWNGFFHSNGL